MSRESLDMVQGVNKRKSDVSNYDSGTDEEISPARRMKKKKSLA